MLVKNFKEAFPKEKLFFCKSPNLLKFLVDIHDIHYINKVLNNDNRFTWVFLKTKDLDDALTEWSNNKKNNTFVYK